jgi:hypothetical protein
MRNLNIFSITKLMYQSYKKIEFNDLNYNGALNTQFFSRRSWYRIKVPDAFRFMIDAKDGQQMDMQVVKI